jgi:hypothetical protein
MDFKRGLNHVPIYLVLFCRDAAISEEMCAKIRTQFDFFFRKY